MVSGVVRIDARGMRCPWPAVQVVADDLNAPGELTAVATAADATIQINSDAIVPTFLILRR